ncbi:Hypothetical predicted protein [Mytilus galloprovincialis]|uniref:Uncharacterized protein n=1 Tax=Mytilus galloprovincialis TaxID=29158 RepID=A0A8B6DXU2_MYTGA|nr:Hypothetical predicted protein [Mytilus galloprovincialis]
MLKIERFSIGTCTCVYVWLGKPPNFLRITSSILPGGETYKSGTTCKAAATRSSGIDEEYGEKETLLDEILSLVEDEEKQKEKQKEKKKETEENRGKEIRKRAMENLTPKKGDDDSNDATPSKRNSSGNIVGYLKEKK